MQQSAKQAGLSSKYLASFVDNNSVDRKTSRGSTTVHLSSATRERLWGARGGQSSPAASAAAVAASSSQGVTSVSASAAGRNRRLSGNHFNIYAGNNGYRSDSSINTQPAPASAASESLPPPAYNNIHLYHKVEAGSCETQGSLKRYANSLESLDAVSCSIQQARAQSSQLHHHVDVALQKQYVTSVNAVVRASGGAGGGSSEALHHSPPSSNILFASGGRNYTSSHGSFQRTFPLRKSTSSHGRTTEEEEQDASSYDLRHLQTNWNEPGRKVSDSFWTPTRSRRTPSNSGKSSPYSAGRSSATSTTAAAVAAAAESRGGITTTNGNVHHDSAEIQRLRRELREEQERVQRLSAQLTTNAHVVSAFEHSLANMASRLEQLNQTSHHKDRELQELRHVINNLKERNEIVGDQAPSRWKSDDNMLATECADMNQHNAKVSRTGSSRSFLLRGGKKNTWFRSSLSKAFGKNKSSGNLSNGCHEILDDGRHQHADDNMNTMAKHRSISTSALDESVVDELQKQLTAKDDLLTETRLEALSSASQLQALREQVAKLRTELRSVKKENEDLKHKASIKEPSSTPSKSAKAEEWTTSSLILESSNLNAYDEALDIPVIIVIQAVPSPMEIRIGSIRIRKNENLSDSKPWKDLDMNVQCLFGLYLARLDPFECLGLTGETSIDSYEFMGRIRKMRGHFDFIDDPEEDNNTPAYIATHTRIILRLKNIDELAFAVLRPMTILRTFAQNLIGESKVFWIKGHPGCGKTFIARRLAEFLIKMKRPSSKGRLSDELVYTFSLKSEDDLKRLDNMSLRVKVVIVDDILDPYCDTFQLLCQTMQGQQKSNVAFICVSDCPMPKEVGWPCLVLSGHQDRLESSFLGYILRRRVLSIETLTQKANDSMIVAVNWLNRVHAQLFDFCLKNGLQMPSMKYFLVKDLPLETSHQFRIWFVDLWNLVLVEEFKKEVKAKDQMTEDPVQIVARTWPWKDQDGGFSQSLRPLFKKSEEDDIFNKDPLMDMLLCLQEATKESSSPRPED